MQHCIAVACKMNSRPTKHDIMLLLLLLLLQRLCWDWRNDCSARRRYQRRSLVGEQSVPAVPDCWAPQRWAQGAFLVASSAALSKTFLAPLELLGYNNWSTAAVSASDCIKHYSDQQLSVHIAAWQLNERMLNDDSFTSGGSLSSSMDLATTPDSPLSLTSKVYALAHNLSSMNVLMSLSRCCGDAVLSVAFRDVYQTLNVTAKVVLTQQ